MFDPQFTITSKLLDNIKKITVIKTELNNRRFPEIVRMTLEKDARDISVHSSTSIEGNPLPLTEVKKILKNKPEFARDSEKEVLNYNNALEFLESLLNDEEASIDNNLILDIHAKVMEELLPKSNLGDFRKTPVFVNNPRTRKTIYLPPDSKDVEDLIKGLLSYINSNMNKIDPVILSGIFHKQFVVIHPFVDGNGRTVRLLTKVLLARMGLDTFNLFSFENYYNKNVSKYFAKVGVLGNYYDIKDKIDFTGWLEYFTDGIVDELLRVSDDLSKTLINPEAALKVHDKKLLKHIERFGFIKDSDYAKLTNRAKATRALDFARLIKLGLIKRKGKGRATYYKFV